jgi:hypothetical protein
MSRALCTTARGRYLQFTSPEVSYLGKGYPLFKTRLRAVLEQFCSDTAELARLACPLGTIVAPGGCLQHRPVRSNA